MRLYEGKTVLSGVEGAKKAGQGRERE